MTAPRAARGVTAWVNPNKSTDIFESVSSITLDHGHGFDIPTLAENISADMAHVLEVVSRLPGRRRPVNNLANSANLSHVHFSRCESDGLRYLYYLDGQRRDHHFNSSTMRIAMVAMEIPIEMPASKTVIWSGPSFTLSPPPRSSLGPLAFPLIGRCPRRGRKRCPRLIQSLSAFFCSHF